MNNMLVTKCEDLFTKYSYKLALAAAFLTPIKLSLCLIFLVPLVLLWLIKNSLNFSSVFNRKEFAHHYPLFIFILISLYSAFFGIDLASSLSSCLSLLFFTFTAFAYCDAGKNGNYLKLAFAMLAGQCLAGAHSIFETLVPSMAKKVFLGEVTESGQLALTFLLALGLSFYCKKLRLNKHFRYLVLLILPVLLLALLVNLKRGPWLGVGAASAVFLLCFSRKLILPTLASLVALFVFVTPLRDRLMQSYEHFSISGGRQVIWEIGSELAMRYPLGIGYNNSHVLRKFSTEIPPELKHFHSNFLNILVETGWLGLFVFIWWIICIFCYGWGKDDDQDNLIIRRTLCCAILAWQIAGLVEYNFGDSEIYLVVMFILGLLAAARNKAVFSNNSI